MIDRLFLAALTFCLLAAGTLAIGSAWFDGAPSAQSQVQTQVQRQPRVVYLPMVEITGRRTDAGTTVARTESADPAASKLQ
jgi:hypothetical protein